MSEALAMTVVSQLAVLVLVVSVLWRMLAAKRRREQAFSAAPGEDGAVEIPVRGTSSRGGFMAGHSRNSINPSLAIGKQGVRIKVLTTTVLPFESLLQIDARGTMTGGTALIFQIQGRIYVARFGEAALARQALALIPARVPLTEEAATLRDGHAGAAAKGLTKYRGPI